MKSNIIRPQAHVEGKMGGGFVGEACEKRCAARDRKVRKGKGQVGSNLQLTSNGCRYNHSRN